MPVQRPTHRHQAPLRRRDAASGSTACWPSRSAWSSWPSCSGSIFSKGYTAFWQTSDRSAADHFDAQVIDPQGQAQARPIWPRSRAGLRTAAQARRIAADSPSSALRRGHPDKDDCRDDLEGGCRDGCAALTLADVRRVVGKTRRHVACSPPAASTGFKGQIDRSAEPTTASFTPSSSTWTTARGRRHPGRHSQPGLFTNRRVEPAGNGGRRRRHHRLALHDADRAGACAADRRRRLDLSRGVRAEEPAGPTSSRSTSTISRPCRRSSSVCSVSRSSSTSSGCRARRRSSAAWC